MSNQSDEEQLEEQLRQMALRYMTPEVYDQILSRQPLEVSNDLRQGALATAGVEPIAFVLVAICEEPVAEITQVIETVVDLALQHKGCINTIVSSLVVVSYGTLRFGVEEQNSQSRQPNNQSVALVEALSDRLGNKIKIVHGIRDGHYGNLGNPLGRMNYSFILPDFLAALNLLTSIHFGTVQEF